MLTLDQIREALSDRRIDIVAQTTGLHPNTVWSIKSGKNDNPKYKAMKALSDYLQG